MQGIGFSVTGAAPSGAQAFDRVIRHAGAGDVFPGTPRTDQEVQCDHQSILKQFLVIVGTNNRNPVEDCISKPGLNLVQQQMFSGGGHRIYGLRG